MVASSTIALLQEHELEFEDMMARGREGLLSFTLATFPDYQVNWHHRVLCKALNRVARGELRRVIIEMQPRVGKSELVSRRLPPFILGRNPDLNVVSASYSHDLASRMNRDVQRVMETPTYKQLFPKARLSGAKGETSLTKSPTAWVRNSGLFEMVGYRGSYRSVGVGGGLTGMGADVAIIDDPIKNQEEADSFIFRQRLWEWWTSTLLTRLEKDARVVILSTRWHEDDLAGRLIAQMKADPRADQWEVISFPAVAEGTLTAGDPRQPGEVLWPEKFDAERMLQTKLGVGGRVWSAMYQQRPSPIGGAIVQRSWWKYYERVPEKFDKVIMAWDLTFTKSATSDFVVGVVLGRKGADIYLLDMVRDRLSFTDSIAAIRAMAKKWPDATAKYVEEAANGHALIDTLKHEVAGMIGIRATGSKVARANAVSPRIEAGNVYLPHLSLAPWVADVVEEWTAFPAGAHDDIVDAMSHGIGKIAEKRPIDYTIVSLPQVNAFKY